MWNIRQGSRLKSRRLSQIVRPNPKMLTLQSYSM